MGTVHSWPSRIVEMATMHVEQQRPGLAAPRCQNGAHRPCVDGGLTLKSLPPSPARLQEARRLLAAGLSVIPILPDGTKRPGVPWKSYQSRLPTDVEIVRWFHSGTMGLAVIGGAVSGFVEILDFDVRDLFVPWRVIVEERCPGLVERLPLSKTPSDGRHLFYRCQGIEGNLKLAQRLRFNGRPETLIETRGRGGYAIIPPSPAACHPLKLPYVLLCGDLTAIPTITRQERAILLDAARSFNEYVLPPHIITSVSSRGAIQVKRDRPGDVFNAQAEWRDILEPHGWLPIGQRGDLTLWKRPGKREAGCSATTNYAASDLLYVFTTNGDPFEPHTAYTKFAAYALLQHGGDFHAAARALARQGYGQPPHRLGDAAAPRLSQGERLPPSRRPTQTVRLEIPRRPRGELLEGPA
jgi:putative DNA primase/helicase